VILPDNGLMFSSVPHNCGGEEAGKMMAYHFQKARLFGCNLRGQPGSQRSSWSRQMDSMAAKKGRPSNVSSTKLLSLSGGRSSKE
jgi:hypothetical protein